MVSVKVVLAGTTLAIVRELEYKPVTKTFSEPYIGTSRARVSLSCDHPCVLGFTIIIQYGVIVLAHGGYNYIIINYQVHEQKHTIAINSMDHKNAVTTIDLIMVLSTRTALSLQTS